MSRSPSEQKNELRWEWQLPGGPRVAATLDVAAAVESVFVGDRRVSRGTRGAAPGGHVVPDAGELPVVVTFDANVPVCILRVDGMEISPASWPLPSRGKDRPPPRQPVSISLGLVWLVLAGLVAALAVFGVRALVSSRSEGTSATLRAPNGLFVARFPPAFAARLGEAPPGTTVAILQAETSNDAIVLLAVPLEAGSREPWSIHMKYYPEVLAALPRANGEYQELNRSDETSGGEAHAIVQGRLENAKGEPAKVWSSAFAHGNAGYVFAYEVREGASGEEEAALRRVVDATELSSLADISSR